MMFAYFTQQEIEQLKILKRNLTIHPTDYFFKRLKKFSDFKDVTGSMLSLQWQYLSSGLSLAIDVFKALGQAAYSLLMFDFFALTKYTYKAEKSAFTAVTKLALALALLFLHTTRLLTLLVATYFPQVALLSISLAQMAIMYQFLPLLVIGGFFAGGLVVNTCLALAYSLLAPKVAKKLATLNKLSNDLRDFRRTLEEILEEREGIINELVIIDYDDYCYELSTDRYRIFTSKKREPSLEIKRELHELNALSRLLDDLLDSYPDIDVNQGFDLGYLYSLHGQMIEHHSKVLEISERYFAKINGTSSAEKVSPVIPLF